MKTNTLRALVAGAAFVPAIAFSAPPVVYGTGVGLADDGAGGVAITLNGLGTNGCPTGYTCDANPISDTGFLQVQMTDDVSGASFFRTIVADGIGAGVEAFRTESFVVAGSTNGGISTEQTLASPDQGGSGTMAAVSRIDTGTFGVSGMNSVVLEQDVNSGNFNTGFQYTANVVGDATLTASATDVNGDATATMQLAQSNTDTDYVDSFNYIQDTSTVGGVTNIDGKAMDITSAVTLRDNGGANLGPQNFGYTLRNGSRMAAPTGSAILDQGTVGATGDTITWSGTSAERVLVGQSMAGIGSFGYERLADSNESINTFDLTQAGNLDNLDGAGTDPFLPSLSGITFTGLPALP